MSLVSGPGKGGASSQLQRGLELVIDRHVAYVQSLDKVLLLHRAYLGVHEAHLIS